MFKANEYGIGFQIIQSNSGKEPIPININNEQLTFELVSYIESLGVEFTNSIIDEIIMIDAFTIDTNAYEIEGSMEKNVEIFSPPAIAAFPDSNGGYLELPLQDFIDILNEWKDFLISLTFQHSLSNK